MQLTRGLVFGETARRVNGELRVGLGLVGADATAKS
jgi:hypothetical protein